MVQNRKISVVKMSGEKVSFDESKLRRSLKRSGANNQLIKQVLSDIKAILYDGISTKEIYRRAFGLLRKKSRPSAARYKLKRAIYELGPSGFPFEKFVAEILSYDGFKTRVGVIVRGHCVNHEVDVVAEKEEKHFMIECKFHSDQGRICNVKIPLYIHSRFRDIEKQWSKQDGHSTKFHQGWVFTNTRFTTDAIQYGNCSGLMLVSWDYPSNGSLKERIDRSGLHPVTCLTTLTRREKQMLLDEGIVLCKVLHQNYSILEGAGVKGTRLKRVKEECEALCSQYSDK